MDLDAYAVLANARQEYASDVDWLENFNVIATILGVAPREVLLVYLMKHITSICKNTSLREPMRGRIIDAMNYLRLLALMEHLEAANGPNN